MVLRSLCFSKPAMAIGNLMMLTSSGNPAEFLKDPDKSNGAFSGFQRMGEGYFASAYQVILVFGVCLFVLAGLFAAICFGIFKDSQKVKENKNWIIRILGAAFIIGLILTLVGIAFSMGSNADVSAAVTPVP